MTSPDTHPGAGAVPVAEETSPWLAMLRRCLLFSCGAVGVLSVAAGFTAGWPGIGSTLFGSALVIAFSGVTLLIGHFAGPDDPMRAMGLFVLAYGVKVIGFGIVLLSMGRPSWLASGWFLGAALATVLVWQVAELKAFTASRRILFAETDDYPGGKQDR